jgi:hypothetical protein
MSTFNYRQTLLDYGSPTTASQGNVYWPRSRESDCTESPGLLFPNSGNRYQARCDERRRSDK